MHKGDCKVFQRNKLQAFFYDDAVMLARFPLQSKADRNSNGESRFLKQKYVMPTIGCSICCSDKGVFLESYLPVIKLRSPQKSSVVYRRKADDEDGMLRELYL